MLNSYLISDAEERVNGRSYGVRESNAHRPARHDIDARCRDERGDERDGTRDPLDNHHSSISCLFATEKERAPHQDQIVLRFDQQHSRYQARISPQSKLSKIRFGESRGRTLAPSCPSPLKEVCETTLLVLCGGRVS